MSLERTEEFWNSVGLMCGLVSSWILVVLAFYGAYKLFGGVL